MRSGSRSNGRGINVSLNDCVSVYLAARQQRSSFEEQHRHLDRQAWLASSVDLYRLDVHATELVVIKDDESAFDFVTLIYIYLKLFHQLTFNLYQLLKSTFCINAQGFTDRYAYKMDATKIITDQPQIVWENVSLQHITALNFYVYTGGHGLYACKIIAIKVIKYKATTDLNNY